MKVISKFLSERVQGDPFGKVNAPNFIYWIMYGKYPKPPLYGRGAAHPEKLIRGIGIDKNIPTRAITKIMDIPGVETRSSCEGESKIKPTFTIIRLSKKDEKGVQNFVAKMNKFSDIECGYDIGNEGKPRIGITTLLWPKKDIKLFTSWWNSLPNKIVECL